MFFKIVQSAIRCFENSINLSIKNMIKKIVDRGYHNVLDFVK